MTPLTTRQEQVLKLVGDGHTIAEIAQSLGLSHGTVHDHVLALRAKLGAGRRRELIPLARDYFNQEGTP